MFQKWASEKGTQLSDNGNYIEIEIVIVIDSHRAYMNISTITTYTNVTLGHCTKIRTKKQIDLYIFSCRNQGWQQVAMERPLTFSKEMRWENSAVLDVQWIGIPKLPRGVSDGEDMVETFRMELLLCKK